jgi:ABC-type glycerol-3-phosphate transport system substrate-binding protein
MPDTPQQTEQTVRRMTRARWLRSGAAALGAAGTGVLAACGPVGPAPADKPAATPVTLTWMTDWTGGPRGEATKQSITAFEPEFPRIKLDMQATKTDTFEALSAHLAAGTLADVLLFGSSFFELWAERGVLMDIGAVLRKFRFDKESVWWDAANFEHKGKTHGLPYQFTISTWVYNKTWFQQDGVRPPGDSWTTDDLLEIARRLNHPSENRWGMEMRSQAWFAWCWVWANGVDLVSEAAPVRTLLDQPKQLEVFEYAIGLIHRHQVAPLREGANRVQGISFENGSMAISAENAAKKQWFDVKDKFEHDVLPTPRWAGTKRRVTNWGHQGHMVTKAAEQRGHGDAATQFVMWMAGEGGQRFVAETGSATPVHKKTAYGPLYLDGKVPSLKLQLDMLERKPDQFARSPRIFKYSTEWSRAVQPILVQGFGGEISVREMATQATRAGNAALDAALAAAPSRPK